MQTGSTHRGIGRASATHQRFILAEPQLDSLEQTIARFNQQIEDYPFEALIELLDTIPGVGQQTAEMVVSEIGVI